MYHVTVRRYLTVVRPLTAAALVFGLLLGLAPGAPAQASSSQSVGETLYAVTVTNRLISFSSLNPCRTLTSQRVTGLQGHERVLGIDFRPATGQLYALGSTSRLYVINPATALATPVSTQPFTATLQGAAFGFDFNPTVDRIRVVSNTGQNLRLHPDTGAVAAVDGNLAYAALDQNAGAQPSVVGAGYTNPDKDPNTGTTLYDIDAALDLLATQNPPNAGTLNTVGGLGVNANRLTGFDISISGLAYAAVLPGDFELGAGAALELGAERDSEAEIDGFLGRKCGPSRLVMINLATGQAAPVGNIGVKTPVIGLAAPTP